MERRTNDNFSLDAREFAKLEGENPQENKIPVVPKWESNF